MESGTLFFLAKKIRPELNTLPDGPKYRQALVEASGILMLLPPSILGMIWLILRTDYGFFADHIVPIGILLVMLYVMHQRSFTLGLKLGDSSTTVPVTSSLGGLVMWMGILIFGIPMLWTQFFFSLGILAKAVGRDSRFTDRYIWSVIFSVLQNIAAVFGSMIVIVIYENIGGTFPLRSDDFVNWIPAFIAVFLDAVFGSLLTMPILLTVNRLFGVPNNFKNISNAMISVSAIGIVMTPFAVIGSLIYTAYGFGVLLFLLLGLFLVNMLAYYLSRTNLKSEQRARELAHLEHLAEAIVQAPADASTLKSILEAHIPNMFPQAQVEIHLFQPRDEANQLLWESFTIINHENETQPDSIWGQLRTSTDNHIWFSDVIPYGMKAPFGDAVLVKIMVGAEGEEQSAICRGGIYFIRSKNVGNTRDSLSAIQTLASQIGSALYRAEVFAETLSLQKSRQELEIAGRIQSSFLPSEIPRLSGWDIAATLTPARQTSGDFYDFVHLENGNLGIIVADVADKGTGAALYMALSRTLIRTYAMQYPDNPADALRAANERILTDTQSNQFVTVFYGILQPDSGTLIYANAGHNPAMVISKNSDTKMLTKTGIPLGMFEGLKWKQETVQLTPTDILMLYTDGASEAQDYQNAEFGENRMIDTAHTCIGQTAGDVQDALMDAIQAFVGNAPQFDDITLMVAIYQ